MLVRAKFGHDLDISIRHLDIDVSYDEARFQKMTFAIRPKYLSLALDVSALRLLIPTQVELRLHLPDIAAAAKILQQAGARVTENGQ